MPVTLREVRLTTLKEFTDFVEQFLLTCGDDSPWYRGCGRSSYKLIPSLYRHPTINDINQLLDLESQILVRFKQRSVPYLDRLPSGDWDYLFLMQHNGIPTRLLDWTENPYIALYFALTAASFTIDQGNYRYAEDVAIWVLNPTIWNRHSLLHMTFKGGILSPSDKLTDGYAPTTLSEHMKNDPIAIYGTHNSPRIVAQRGVFTIFGKTREPMEDTYLRLQFPQDSLVKLVIPAMNIQGMLKSTISVGFTDSVVFPDLDGLAKETKRFFGYTV